MNAVTFDGRNYLTGTPPFAGGAFGRGIFSYFYRGAGVFRTGAVLAGTDGAGNSAIFEHQLEAGAIYLRVRLQGNIGGSGLIEFRSEIDIPHNRQWYGVIVSWNTLAAGGTLSTWLAGSRDSRNSAISMQQVEGEESTGFSIGPAAMTWVVGQEFRGCLSELWFMGGSAEYTDIAGAESLAPLMLEMAGGEEGVGVQGKGPFGVVPLDSLAQIYLRGPAATFANNHGGGSAFMSSGGLGDCVDGPAPRASAVAVAMSAARGVARFVAGRLSRTDNAVLVGPTQAVRN